MIRYPLTEESLKEALTRLENFQAVHADYEDLKAGLEILRESLGIDDEMMRFYHDELKRILGPEADAPFIAGGILGLMVGLIAADHVSETRSSSEP